MNFDSITLMKNLLAFSILAFAIVGFALMPIQQDAFATKDDNNGKAKGCENANEKSQAREKNPHCEAEIDVTITVLSRSPGNLPIVGGTCTITLLPSQEVIVTETDENGITEFSVPSDTASIDVACGGPAPPFSTGCDSYGTFEIDPEGVNEFTTTGTGCL